MNIEQEQTEALGFHTVEEMNAHARWLIGLGDPVHLNWLESVKRENGLAAETYVPCLLEVDPETLEATGTVSPFCSVACRSLAMTSIGFPVMQFGVRKLSDFGYTPHCEECGRELLGHA